MESGSFRYFLLVIFLFNAVKCLENGEANATYVPQQTYKEAEKEITAFINDQLRSLLPRIVGGAGDSNLSQRCMAGMMKILSNVRRLKGWTLKILDSIGKPSAGILKGTSYSLGHYDQCVDLAVTSKGLETHNTSEAMFQGMYCKVRIQFASVVREVAKEYHKGHLNESELGKLKEIIQAIPYVPVTTEYMSHFLGICLPSSCTLEDVQELLGIISFPGTTVVESCHMKSGKDINNTELTVIIIFLALISLVCGGTFIHWLLHNKIDDMLSEDNDRRCVSVIIAFSFCNNTKRLMNSIEDDTDHVLSGLCVRGIVVASIAWIILGHSYLLPYDAFYMQSSSLEHLRNYLSEAYFSFVVNFPLAVDALLLCYGFIMTYALWNSTCRTRDVKVNVFQLIICNYLRFCVPVLMFLGVVILLPIIGSGPFWKDIMEDDVDNCYKNVWSYVGMYSNFNDEGEQCFPHMWFTSCLAQLTLSGIILNWIMSRNVKFGIVIVVLLALASNITVGTYTYNNDYPPSFVAYFKESFTNSFWKLHYSLPLIHFAPYALGILTGLFVARRSHHKLRPCIAAIGWLVCLIILGGLFIFIFKYHEESKGKFWSAVYAGSHRTLFGFCVAWVIVACSFGNGGFVNAILSWRIFDPLFRLSYYAYIVHFLVITYTVGVAREHFHYSHQEMVFRFISYIAVTYFVSYILYMMLEMPLKSLCCSFRRKRSSRIDVTSQKDVNLAKLTFLTPKNTIQGTCRLWSISNNKMSVSY